MKKSLPILLSALAVLAMLHSASNLLSATFAQSKAVSQRWEHCAITEFFGTGGDKAEGYAKISFFDPAGYREQWIKAEGETITFSNRSDRGIFQRAREMALADAIAQLGSQGWEMVGEARYARERNVQLSNDFNTTQDDSAIYFKRLKP